MKLRRLAIPVLGFILGSRAGKHATSAVTEWPADEPSASGSAESRAGNLQVIAASRGETLAEGMGIRAAIEGRVLGLRLLTLEADVAVMPAEVEPRRKQGLDRRNGSTREATETHRVNPPGAGETAPDLADAARALEASSVDLRMAREHMP